MELTVANVMTNSVVSIRPDQTIDEAFDLFLRHAVSGLPVVDDYGNLVGILSERDLMGLLSEPDTAVDQVVHYATGHPLTVKPLTPLLEAIDLMLAHPYRRLPVVDDDGRLVGVVSRRDLIRFIRDMRRRMAITLEHFRHHETAGADEMPARS